MVGTLLCVRCGHPIEDHTVSHDEISPELLPRLTQALFPGVETSGMYCPHLDMVAGEDYEE